MRTDDEPDPDDDVWIATASIAIEVLSRDEDEAAKVGDYRRVVGAGDLALDELWYMDVTAAEVRVYDPATGVTRRGSSFVSIDALHRTLFG